MSASEASLSPSHSLKLPLMSKEVPEGNLPAGHYALLFYDKGQERIKYAYRVDWTRLDILRPFITRHTDTAGHTNKALDTQSHRHAWKYQGL